ncbi:MAG: SpoIID/LytB domain-containing protein [Bacteroidales bacterium]|jgi:stage II sporulation protein D|nr:SpoIID/LytB domain-containing protein [Bacteroidales bacterium]
MKTTCQHSLFIFGFLVLSLSSIAQKLDVRIFSDEVIDAIAFSTRDKEYHLVNEDSVLFSFAANQNLRIVNKDTCFLLIHDSLQWNLNAFTLGEDTASSGFFINLSHLETSARAYQGDLHISHADHGVLLINRVNLEDYTAGVVEAEGGYAGTLEYYKTQAVICRTYALRNIYRHEDEGFQLCDRTHCQVYHGKAGNSLIIEASRQTHGQVIVDENFKLINAVYHSNSGGQTANSVDVWTSQLPYLVSVTDTFSLAGNHAKWHRSISLTEWHIFLENRGVNIGKLSDEEMIQRLQKRIATMNFGHVQIPMREIRKYFGLKSAFFEIEIIGKDLVFKGKGYGHGVGLAQEGAMEMARAGYTYDSIISHYYKNTSIVGLQLLKVFEGLEKVSGEE